MSTAALRLERFDAPASAANEAGVDPSEGIAMQRARASAFAEGYAAGQAAAAARAGEHEKHFAALARSIETEILRAPERAVADAAAAVRALLESVLPSIAREGFAVEAALAFSRAASAQGGAVEIAAPKDFAGPIEALLRTLVPNAPITVRVDPELAGMAARAAWPGGGVDVDVDAATRGCLDALRLALDSFPKEKAP